MSIENVLIYLLKCAINGETPKLANDIDYNALYQLCQSHKVTQMVYYPLKNAGVQNDAFALFEEKHFQQIKRTLIQSAEFESVTEKLYQNGIDALAFKGRFIASLYPSEDMRYSSDVDLLVDEKNLNAAGDVLLGLGYLAKRRGTSIEDAYYKLPIMYLELHSKLFFNDDFGGVFDRVFENAVRFDNGNYLTLTLDDLYVYCVAHFYKHYQFSGCGVRFVVDHYLLNQHITNQEYINKQLKQAGLLEFKQKMDKIVQKWFETDQNELDLDDDDKYILGTSLYGSHENAVKNQMKKINEKHKNKLVAKLVYCFRRIFPTLDFMKMKYAAVNKHPFLLPLYWIVRIIQTIFRFKR